MKIPKTVQEPLVFSRQLFGAGGKDYLGVSLVLGFSLLEAGALLDQGTAWKAAIASLAPYGEAGVSLDPGMEKVRGEFFLAGDAYASPPPGGWKGEFTGVSAAVGLGPLYREFLVTGDSRREPSGRLVFSPFRSLPLSWENTAAGPENPRGWTGESGSSGAKVPAFPRVIEPQKGFSPRDLVNSRPLPACPLPRPFGPDFKNSGSFGADWLQEAWPGFPADFDFSVFNLAQEPQRLKKGYFRGDEEFYLKGFLPDRREARGRLPGKKARVVLRRELAEGGSSLSEIQCPLDTVWFFPSHGVGLLIWHGAVKVQTENAGEIKKILAFTEDLFRPGLKTDQILAYEAEDMIPPLVVLKALPPKPSTPEALTPPPSAPALGAPLKAPSPEIPAPEIPKPEIPTPPALPPAASTPDPSEISVPEIMQGAREDISNFLPDVNKALKDKGLDELSIEAFEPFLRKEQEKLLSVQNAIGSAAAAGKAAAGSSSDAELLKLGRADALAGLMKGGLTEEEAGNVLNALDLPVPFPGAFPDGAAYEAALKEYGEKWSSLFGLPQESAAKISSRIKTMDSFISGKLDKTGTLASLLEGELPAGQAGPLINFLEKTEKASALPFPPKKFLQELNALGLDEDGKAGVIEAFRKMETEVPKPLPDLASTIQSVNAFLLGIAPAFGMSTDRLLAKSQEEFELVRRAAWGNKEIGDALKTLAGKHPELETKLPELERLRQGNYQEVMKFKDLALKAGISGEVLLQEISSLDPLNTEPLKPPLPPVVKKDVPPPVTAVPTEPADPFPQGRIFHSREEFTEALKLQRENPKETDLKGPAAAGLDLSGLDLSGLNLSGADFKECDLSGASFKGSDLSGACLSRSLLKDCELSGATLRGADLSFISGARFYAEGADFTGADFTEADLTLTDLNGVLAESADFTRALLPKRLKAARLKSANFYRADLSEADFGGSDLSSASFDEAALESASFARAKLNGCSFVNCPLNNADFSGIYGKGPRFYLQTVLDGASFAGAELTGGVFLAASAKGASFKGAKADGCNFSGLDLRGSDFEGASLREALFSESILSGALFDGADLMRAVLGSAFLQGARFRGASLYAADLFRAKVDRGTDFKGADLNRTVLVADGQRLAPG
ncbi:MAG: pentapeptide repeat-containing protein [Deltaproteobacteria bacterium]|jgi:uncharacterized protein YjbI with pentapeptide repeats|nr:pentapeptide repeat-containing protein [Deltaproteobacteria bacterium]